MGNGSLPPEDPELAKIWRKQKEERLKANSVPDDEPLPKENPEMEPASKTDDS